MDREISKEVRRKEQRKQIINIGGGVGAAVAVIAVIISFLQTSLNRKDLTISTVDQGVIDGGDSPLSDIVSIKMYETTPEITLTGHLLVIHSLYINEKFYQSLPEQDKKWIDEAAKRSADYVWDLVEKVDADAVKTITEAGGHVSEPSPELHKFMQDAGKRSWKLFYDTVPNAKEILDSADSYRQAK